jgi:carboxylate-amine ligase
MGSVRRMTVSAVSLRELFDGVTDHTVGVEEELMLLDPDTLDLLPVAARVHAELGERVSLRGELPAAQVETASPVCDSIDQAARALADARRALAGGVAGWARLAGAGTHPFAAPEGPLRDDPKYDPLKAAFPWALPQQLVFGLHVHVAVRGADRALAVLNALRSYLPDLAALAGNAPLHAGRDTGLASVRPEISGLLPRQGVPPAFASWEDYADYLAWGRRGGLFPQEGEPWWEARGHDELGTIELRVPDAQTTPEEAAGVLALGAGLVAWLAARFDAGEPLPVHDTIRISENRWRALRHGLGGSLLDLDSGEQQPTRDRVLGLIDRVAPAAERLGGAAALEHARTLAARNGAERQRAISAEHGPRGVVETLAEAFLP